ncbi:MAG: GAF domain-containing protein [Thalassobaculaceae bacterium]|tara:strand:+ start:1012 stop:1605 length:594 start_codon:yes stop_codon:yes gene_type:complete
MADSIVSNSKKLGSIHLEQLAQLMKYAQTENAVETILKAFSTAAMKTLGDPSAAKIPGNLKANEYQFSVAGFFLHIPERKESCLVAEQGFPMEQHRLCIPDDVGHPGWVVKHKKPLLLSNTDEHSDFKQILKSARMGSAMYSPMFSSGTFIGQFITASQARQTYRIQDHEIHQVYTSCANLVFNALNGSSILKLHPE